MPETPAWVANILSILGARFGLWTYQQHIFYSYRSIEELGYYYNNNVPMHHARGLLGPHLVKAQQVLQPLLGWSLAL